jgi:hypothetical protein
MWAAASTAPGAVTSSNLPPELARELTREDREVLYPLLDRLVEAANRIDDGERVDPDYVGDAIRLWGRYVNGRHERRVEQLRETLAPPAHRPSRHRASGFRPHSAARGPKLKEAADPAITFSEIRADQERMEQRLVVLLSLLGSYRRGEYMAAQLLASLLRSGATADRAWASYEETFARERPAVPPAPPHDAAAERPAEPRLPADEAFAAEVRRFLARPVPILANASPA